MSKSSYVVRHACQTVGPGDANQPDGHSCVPARWPRRNRCLGGVSESHDSGIEDRLIAYMWQALETKARFIGQVMTGENATRRAEDIIEALGGKLDRLSNKVRETTLSHDHQGPQAVLNALERLAGGYGSECDRVQRDLGIAQSQLRDCQARLGKSFPQDVYLAELTTLRDQLKSGLSGASQEPGKEEGPSTSELSERI
jgi:hypothetical protein